MTLFESLKPADYQKKIENADEIKKSYRYWRIRIFYSMYIGYAFYYLTRKSFTFAMPAMVETLGFSKADLGVLGSILYLTYGISKFLSGIISDKSNPRYFMSVGLILTGICNILFGLSSSIYAFAIFWGLNGWFQGFGWPPCAKLLTHWYSQSERGTWWGFWNTCHNVGGALIPLITAIVCQGFGWRFSMFFPGIACILAGLFLLNRLRDTPQSLGLPSIERYHSCGNFISTAEEGETLTTKEILVTYVLKNYYIWILAIAYFFIYIIRTAVNDWGYFFLYEHKQYSLLQAGMGICAFEIGGFVGSLAAGWLSDNLFKGRRAPINILFSLFVLLMLLSFWYIPPSWFYLDISIMFFIGFFIFGPQMLIGVAAAELSHKNAAGTATGFAGCFAYGGAAVASLFGKIAQDFGWYGFLIALAACAAIAAVLLLPLWPLRTNPKYSRASEKTLN